MRSSPTSLFVGIPRPHLLIEHMKIGTFLPSVLIIDIFTFYKEEICHITL